MKLFITGGGGRLGTGLTAQAAAHGMEVLAPAEARHAAEPAPSNS
jgi:dTDP-4-dehydrorhamnose reductase